MYSGLKDADIERLVRTTTELQWDFTTQFSDRATHLVVKAKKGSPLARKRTLKYILGVLAAVPIVKSECTSPRCCSLVLSSSSLLLLHICRCSYSDSFAVADVAIAADTVVVVVTPYCRCRCCH
jgi:hypothetical protein